MEEKKKNKGLVVIIIVLVLVVLGLTGFIVYDKVLKDNDVEVSSKEETKKDDIEIPEKEEDIVEKPLSVSQKDIDSIIDKFFLESEIFKYKVLEINKITYANDTFLVDLFLESFFKNPNKYTVTFDKCSDSLLSEMIDKKILFDKDEDGKYQGQVGYCEDNTFVKYETIEKFSIEYFGKQYRYNKNSLYDFYDLPKNKLFALIAGGGIYPSYSYSLQYSKYEVIGSDVIIYYTATNTNNKNDVLTAKYVFRKEDDNFIFYSMQSFEKETQVNLKNCIGEWYYNEEHYNVDSNKNPNTLSIKTVNNNSVTMDLYITRTANFDNFKVEVKDNEAMFEAVTTNGLSTDKKTPKITAKIKFYNKKIVITVIDSNVVDIDKGNEYIFTYKA